MLSWPEPGDSLLTAGVNPRTEALLGADPDWIIAYALSFKEAADIIVLQVESGSTSPDAVNYPVVFLYRHYLELILKGLIRVGRSLTYEPAAFPITHQLSKLWAEFRPLIEDVYPQGDKVYTDTVEHCVLEMDTIDGGGDASRYGEDRTGQPTFPKELLINLTNLRDVMNRVSGFLEGSYDWMHELLQHQADMESEAY
jgi:hypothetical protein